MWQTYRQGHRAHLAFAGACWHTYMDEGQRAALPSAISSPKPCPRHLQASGRSHGCPGFACRLFSCSLCCLFPSLPAAAKLRGTRSPGWTVCRGLREPGPLVAVFLANAAENSYHLPSFELLKSHADTEKSSDEPCCMDPEASVDSSPCPFSPYYPAV